MKSVVQDFYFLGHVLLAELIGRFPLEGIRKPAIDGLARLSYWVSRKKRMRVESNVELAYGAELSLEKKQQITLGCFREFWREMVDWVPGSDASSPSEVRIHGLQHLEQALALGKGVILWESNGFSRRIRGKQVLHAHGIEVYQTHGVTHLGVMDASRTCGSWLRTRFLRPLYERRERRFNAGIIDVPLNASPSSALAYLRVLRGNQILCLAGDGQIAQALYPVRLLGRTFGLAPGAVKLSRFTGAAVLPMFWNPGSNGHASLEIDAPVRIPPTGDEKEDLSRILQSFADALEARVRSWPEHYRNWHEIGELQHREGH